MSSRPAFVGSLRNRIVKAGSLAIMTREFPPRYGLAVIVAAVFDIGRLLRSASCQKTKPRRADPERSHVPLFQMLDDSHGGKLIGFYILGDTFTGQRLQQPADADIQHVLMVEYDKRTALRQIDDTRPQLSKLAPEQLKTYTLKQIYDFGVDDSEKFSKTEPGQLGRSGDLYVAMTGDGRVASAPVTDEVRKALRLLPDAIRDPLRAEGRRCLGRAR